MILWSSCLYQYTNFMWAFPIFHHPGLYSKYLCLHFTQYTRLWFIKSIHPLYFFSRFFLDKCECLKHYYSSLASKILMQDCKQPTTYVGSLSKASMWIDTQEPYVCPLFYQWSKFRSITCKWSALIYAYTCKEHALFFSDLQHIQLSCTYTE